MSARRHRNKAMVVVGALVVAASARGHVPDTIPPDTEVLVEKPRRSTALYGDFITGEPFSQTDFWTSEPTAVALDAGVSEVWVFSPEGTTGRFTLGFGVEEDFEAGDLVELLFDAGDY